MDDIEQKVRPKYSVVIPVYNSAATLDELCRRLTSVFESNGLLYEIILVNDASSDNSWQVMKELKQSCKSLKIIQLMRNFGQHNALICGFHYVTGHYVITMDDDLQNPPEEIPKLISKMNNGYDVVIGAQIVKQHSMFKNFSSFVIRYLNERIFNKPKDLRLSSFRIMTRAVTDEIKTLKTPYPYISGQMLSITRNIVNVEVIHDKRKFGKSTYTFRKLLNLAFNLVINYSSLPLRVLTLIGLAVSAISFCMGMFFIAKKLLVGIPVGGWTSVVVLLSFFNGLLLIIISIIGEYLGRIINEVSNRQQFVVREKNLD